MQKTQEKDFSMMLVVEEFADGVSGTIADLIPGFVSKRAMLKENIVDIETQMEIQRLNRKGEQERKAAKRGAVTIAVLDLVNKGQALARNRGDEVLLNELDFCKSSLSRMSDANFTAAAQIIISKATENAADLVAFGVTAGMLTNSAELQVQYQGLIPKPKTGINTKKAATAALDRLIRQAKANLADMDGMIKALQLSHSDFYRDYTNARRIGKASFTKILAMGQVITFDGTPIEKVTMECEALGFSRKVTKMGRFTLKGISNGSYVFVFSRTGYRTVKITINIYHGVREEIVVVMEEE